MSAPIRILLVDDQALFRESLALLLNTQPDLLVVGAAANGQAALDLVPISRQTKKPYDISRKAS